VSRGHDRERAVKRLLEEDGWFVTRAAGSLGDADLVACRPARSWALRGSGHPFAEVRIVEVKSTARGPFAGFPPGDRIAISLAAVKAGATAWLAWWPPRGELRWIAEPEWPAVRAAA
jgi:Holliday junction resolvase